MAEDVLHCATQGMSDLARMIVAFCASPSDVRSIERFCQISPIGFSRASFRRRCEALGVEAGDVLRLARLIRAADQGRRRSSRMIDQLDVDPRTYRGLLIRADLSDLLHARPPTVTVCFRCRTSCARGRGPA